jgi:hypothetical protein
MDAGCSFDMARLSATAATVQGVSIQVTTVRPLEFRNKDFADHTFLRRAFDVIFVGGNDASYGGLKDFDQSVIDGSLIPYHGDGGNVVFFHDVLYTADGVHDWSYFRKLVGAKPGHDIKFFEHKVERYIKSGDALAILTKPFSLDNSFPIAPTHVLQVADADKKILVGCGTSLMYYAEHDRMCVCEAGHSPHTMTEQEWQFLVNVTVHLSETSRRKTGD